VPGMRPEVPEPAQDSALLLGRLPATSVPSSGRQVVSYTYVGVDRVGAGVSGRTTLEERSLADWVRRRWARGWQELSVHLDGREVGGIVPQPFGRPKRVWWSE
jgi:hypothetical protein